MQSICYWLLCSSGFSVQGILQEYQSGLPCPPPGDLPHQGIEPTSPALQEDSLLLSYWGSPIENYRMFLMTVIVINQRKVYFLNFKKWLSLYNHSFHLIRVCASDTLWTWLSLTHLNLVMILWNSPIIFPNKLFTLPKTVYLGSKQIWALQPLDCVRKHMFVYHSLCLQWLPVTLLFPETLILEQLAQTYPLQEASSH